VTAARFAVQYDPHAVKELGKLDKAVARRIVRAVDALGGNPWPSGSRPLVGHQDLSRIRVGAYRVIFTIKDGELLVLALRVAHRSEVYRSL
jgi:mRNA interferase RelE/StbE